jgi:hypothetical protein
VDVACGSHLTPHHDADLELAADHASHVSAEPAALPGLGPPRRLPRTALGDPRVVDPGRPLEATTRTENESRFGWDLAAVRIHTGPPADGHAARFRARAYTVGSHVYFGRGRYDPGSAAGRSLLSHEIAHVVQQGTGAAPLAPALAPEGPGAPLEREESTDERSNAGLSPPIDLADGTRIQLITTATTLEERLPGWLPAGLREQILRDDLPPGVMRWRGDPPWGDIVIWVAPPPARESIEIYQEFPSDEAFYAEISGDSSNVTRLLFDVYTAYNRDMAYFVEQKGMSPAAARNELRRINDEVFRLVIEASMTILVSGASVGAVISTQRALVEAAERTGFSAAGGAEKVPFTGKEQQQEIIDAIVARGPTRERPAPEIVVKAQQALVDGVATGEDYLALLQDSVEDAWNYLTLTRKGLGKPSNLPHWEIMRNACGAGRDCSVASIATMTKGSAEPVIIRRFQASAVISDTSTAGVHAFSTVEFADGTKFLVDPTFAQFLRAEGDAVKAGSNIRELVMAEEAITELTETLLRQGFVPLDDITAALYVRCMEAVAPRMMEPAKGTAVTLARRITDGSAAETVEVVGTGQAGVGADLRLEVTELLDVAEEAHTQLVGAGDDLAVQLEWLMNKLDQGE